MRVEKDHHVKYLDHYYSVPWEWTGERVDVWYSHKIIEIYNNNERIASHVFSGMKGRTTNDSHRPPNHLFTRKLKPCWVLSEVSEIGTETLKVFRNMIEYERSHCEVAIRKCMGILKLKNAYGADRLEKAIGRALTLACVKEPDIRRMLEQGLEEAPLYPEPIPKEVSHADHENLRGAVNYEQLPHLGE